MPELPEMDDAIDRFLLRRWQGKDPDEKEVKRTVDALIRRGHSWKDIQSGLRPLPRRAGAGRNHGGRHIMTHTIGMISLGCAKNQVNAEHMLWLLRQAGYEISPDPDGAELVIVNTCGFIESAKTEAIDNILAMAQLKAEGRIQKILVTGCLAQRYQEEILKELPEVDGVLGTGSYYDVANAVGQVLSGKRYKRFDDINADQSEDGRILTTPEYYAYLKIAEGCDNHCAYCVIPKLRGKLRSRPMEDLIKEAEQLASDGVKELIVVAQDTSRYGLDLYGERKLAEPAAPGSAKSTGWSGSGYIISIPMKCRRS